MENNIVVHLSNSETDSYENCTMMIDNCDHSIRIEHKGDTVAHYKRDQWAKITQTLC